MGPPGILFLCRNWLGFLIQSKGDAVSWVTHRRGPGTYGAA
jgi:hypothetical protein